jgi:hypothetical protein
MLVAISGPIGGALSQLLAPTFSTVAESVSQALNTHYIQLITNALGIGPGHYRLGWSPYCITDRFEASNTTK